MRPSRCAVLLLSLLVCAAPARAQDADGEFWTGTHLTLTPSSLSLKSGEVEK